MEPPLIIFTALIAIVLMGIAVVLWLLRNEGKESLSAPQQPISNDELLKRIGVEKDFLSTSGKPAYSVPEAGRKPKKRRSLFFWRKESSADDIPQASSFPMLKDYLQSQENRKQEEKISHNAIPNLEEKKISTVPESIPEVPPPPPLSEEQKEVINQEIEASINTNDLKAHQERLEKILSEKNVELEKTRSSLDNELKNRKDFNKVKDILEKELKDGKIQARDNRLKWSASQTEVESQKVKIAQLEEKVVKLEKRLLAKEEEIDKLVREQQMTQSLMTTKPLENKTPANPPETGAPPVQGTPPAPALPPIELKSQDSQPPIPH